MRAAFGGVSRPAALAAHRSSEVDDMEHELRAPSWDAATVGALMRHRAALGMLSPDAFRFYLPAYLVAGLDPANVDLREAALHALAPHSRRLGPNDAEARRFRELTSTLDDAQRDAIKLFVRWARTQTASPKGFPALDLKGVWGTEASKR